MKREMEWWSSDRILGMLIIMLVNWYPLRQHFIMIWFNEMYLIWLFNS